MLSKLSDSGASYVTIWNRVFGKNTEQKVIIKSEYSWQLAVAT